MKSVGGAGLVVIGMLFLYLAITGKLDCFFNFIACISSNVIAAPATSGSTGGSSSGGINWGSLINQYGGQIIDGVFHSSGTSSSGPSSSPFGAAPSIHT